MVRLLLIAFLFGPVLAGAETYKWVDEKGVVNYSNTPPPQAAQTVPDRLSSYSSEPAASSLADVSRRLEADQREWLQRQYLMAMQYTAPAPATDYLPAYYPAYGVFAVRRAFIRPFVFTPVRTHRFAPVSTERASLRRF